MYRSITLPNGARILTQQLVDALVLSLIHI